MIDLLIIILTWIGYLFAIIGFGATVYKSMQAWMSLKTLSWKEVEKYSKKVIKEISQDEYIPDVIVAIGRGGSVFGAMLSGNISSSQKHRNIPIIGYDRIYEWENGNRIEKQNRMVDFRPLTNKKVLLVAGDILTGGTMKFVMNLVSEANVSEIKTACLVKGITSALQPDYYGKEIPADFKMPWMFKGYGYARDSRKPKYF